MKKLLFALWICALLSLTSARFRVAFCLTGQLARLEVLSKIKNIFIPNMLLGHKVFVFTLLDGNVSDVQQTLYSYDYSKNPYSSFNASQLNSFMEEKSTVASMGKSIVYRTRFEGPAQREFAIIGPVPVADKSVFGVAHMESGASRFQKNMRWLSAVRGCVKWIQEVEFQQRWFFDVVVRLRDDSYALGPWKLTPISRYKNSIVSVNFGQHQGINDHNFVVDRKWADSFLRGVTEDYYFNSTLDKIQWYNPEHRLATLASALQIPVVLNTACQQPLIPLRGPVNASLWRLHHPYVKIMMSACNVDEIMRINKLVKKKLLDATLYNMTCCGAPWMQIILKGNVPVEPMPPGEYS